jgi:hypothetical protein
VMRKEMNVGVRHCQRSPRRFAPDGNRTTHDLCAAWPRD